VKWTKRLGYMGCPRQREDTLAQTSHTTDAPPPGCWARDLDALRREPARPVFGFDLIRLGIAGDEKDLGRLPPPLPLPRARFLYNRAWEARAVLAHLGLPVAAAPTGASLSATPFWQPGQPLPRHADRKTLAAIITSEYGPVTHRVLEEWPLVGRRFGSRMVFNVKAALAIARQRFEAAPERKGGRARGRERALAPLSGD
jgi:hypothetical protein